MKIPTVSIIIPAYNEERVISRLLKSIKRQSYSHIETIVIDDQSTDQTASIAKKYGAIVQTRVHSERSKQRNYGAKIAKGEYLLFLDADMELENDVIESCIKSFNKDSNTVAVIIPEQSIASNYWETAKAFERSLYNRIGDANTDAARFFLKKAFEEVGGYDESLIGPEDWDLPETLKERNYNISRVKAKILHYERLKSPFNVARKKYYYALTSHRYFQKHNIPVIGSKSVYILRPVFYKNWKLILKHPKLSFGMFVIVTLEQLYGTIGYLYGKIKSV